jgi:uncharacterized membrane protein
MTAKHFSMSEAINFGWEVTKSNFLFLLGVLLIAGLVGALPQAGGNRNEASALSCVLGLVSFVLNTIISMGLTKITLEFVDRQSPSFGDLFAPAPLFLNFFVAELICGFLVAVGLVFFIIPGIIVAIVFGFYSFLIVDHGLGPIEALSRSAEITKGARMSLFLFGLLILGINFLGLLALVIGLFVTVPISMIAWAYVFRQLERQTAAPGV